MELMVTRRENVQKIFWVRNSLFKLIKNLKGGFIIAAFLALWELLPRLGLIEAAFLPPFSNVMATFLALLLSGKLVAHTLISLQRAFIAFSLAILIGIPLGFLMGWYKEFEKIIDPLFQILRQTSALALFPAFILFFGIGEISKIAIILWVSIWEILLNTISGVKAVDPTLIKSARSMGASDVVLFRKVIFPAAIPSIMTGLRLGATASILLVVAAEMIGSNSGLGFLVISSQYNFEISEMYAAIITLALLGVLSNYTLIWIEKKATIWKEEG